MDDSDAATRDKARALANRIVQRIAELNNESASQLTQLGSQDDNMGMGNSGFSPALAADDLEEMSDIDDDELEEEKAPKPGNATQIANEVLDEGAGTRVRRLRELRDEVVELLRAVPNAGPMPSDLYQRAQTLRRYVAAFMSVSEAARRMSGVLSELLTREIAYDGGGPSGEMPDARVDGAPMPDAPGAPQKARIVGRATDVQIDGSRRQSFLLFQPPRSYVWLTEVGMRNDPALLAILNAYDGPKGDDPTGNGYVVAIVRARGPTGRRQYRVRWTVEPQVPVKYAEPEWLLRRQFVNPDLVDAFEQRLRDDDASGDEDDDADVYMGDAESQDTADDKGGPSALKWSPAQGRPLLSMRRAVQQQGGAHLGALWEYTFARMLALRCRAPPASGEPGAPTEDELAQLGRDLYEVQRKSLDAVFRRERDQEARDRLLEAEEEEEVEDDDAEEQALAAWRAERESELRADAVARWRAIRAEDAPQMARLRAQLEAIEALEVANGNAAAVPTAIVDLLSDAAAGIVAEWGRDPDKGAALISQPRLRLPRIRDVLSQPSRSAVTDGWLKLLRSIHSDTAPAQRLASAYGPNWPQRPGPTATPPDHVVATRALRMGAGLVIENGDASQNPLNLVLCTLSQNSAKSDSVLGLFSAPGEVQGAAGQDVYSPAGVSEIKRAMLAKIVAMMFGLYWGITNKKRSSGIGSYYINGTGMAVYKRALEMGPFKSLIQRPATAFERRNALITAAVPQWSTCSALVFDSSLFDARFERLIDARMGGMDELSKLVDATLKAGVAGAPR